MIANPLTRPSDTLSPNGGEGRGERARFSVRVTRSTLRSLATEDGCAPNRDVAGDRAQAGGAPQNPGGTSYTSPHFLQNGRKVWDSYNSSLRSD
jgi:hypothetical protein